MHEIDHISHSQLNLYDMCPRAWQYRYIDKIYTPSSPALVEGDCYHRTLEYNFKYKMRTGEDIDINIIPDVFSKHWDDILDSSEIDWGSANKMHVRDEGSALACKYIEEIAPNIQPTFVERWFEAEVAGVKFVLRADLMDQNSAIIDHKTSGRRYTQKDTDNDLQASAIAYVIGKPIIFYNHVAVKKRAPEIQILRTYRTQDDIDWWLDKATCTIELMRSGYYPPNITSWLCGDKYCGFYERCKGHLRKTPI